MAIEAVHLQSSGMELVRKSNGLGGHIAFLVTGEGISTEMHNHGNKADTETGKQQVS
jgi:hypothetical protein